MSEFLSIKEFSQSKNEIKLLLKLAQKNEKNVEKYRIFIKSAILLLSAKLETFIEDILSEMKEIILNNKKKFKDLPIAIRHSAILHYYNINELDKIPSKIRNSESKKRKLHDVKGLIANFLVLFNDNKIVKDLPINTSFKGKHGTNEIIRLFKQLNGENIFEIINNGNDLKGAINSLIVHRNDIIHRDKSPSLTHNDVIGLLNKVEEFAIEVNKYLINYLQEYRINF